jgi:hypothetical protein
MVCLHLVIVVRPSAVGIGEKINALPRRHRSVSLGAIRCPPTGDNLNCESA